MKPQSFNDILAGGAFMAGIFSLVYLAVITKSELVIGALVNLVGMGAAWYYRGRVSAPTDGGQPPTA